MLIIYTGNGKGKTSATVGQAIRAYGQGLRVTFGQFMKKPDQAGEQKVCAQLFGDQYKAGGIGFFRDNKEYPLHRKAALTLLQWAETLLAETDMLLLDEALYAFGHGLLTQEEITHMLQLARQYNTHVVLSGRGLPDWLAEQADLITEMKEIKHPYATGVQATRGIEY